MGFFKQEKTLAEIEEQSAQEDAIIDLKKKQLIRKGIEEKLGGGGMGLFKAKGDNEESIFKKAATWLKNH